MHLSKSALASVLLLSRVSADFDIWLRQMCQPDTQTGNTETCSFDWVTVPANTDNFCQAQFQKTLGGFDDHPCEKWLAMNGGNGSNNTIIHNCANNYNSADGSYYGDVLHYNTDGTSVTGTCQVWKGASGREVVAYCGSQVELLLSRIACKISGIDGTA